MRRTFRLMKKFLFLAFTIITFLPAVTYFFSCFTPYISPVEFWPMAFLALGFPYLAPVIIVLAIIWFFIDKRVFLALLLLFFLGFQNLFSTFALSPSSTSTNAKVPGSLRVLTWNVRGFDNPSAQMDSLHSVRRQMFDYISKADPDVICIQEFSEHYVKGCLSNTAELIRRGYKHCFKTNEIVRVHSYGDVVSGSAIFSKIPISDTGKILLGDPSYTEYIAFADVLLQNKKVRIFATHFKSLNLFAGPVDTANKVVLYGDSNFIYHKNKFEKLKAFSIAHTKEAFIAKEVISKSPYPVIVGVDMNSVPTSYQLNYMASGLQDAFKLNGWGLGTTMDNLPKTLRIDFLLVDKKLSIKNYRKEVLHLSDHFPQFIDVVWSNN